MAERIALYLQDDLTVSNAIDLVRHAEARGFFGVWQAEARFARDPIVMLTAYARSTMRIQLGLGAINHWTKHPLAIASELLTLEDLAPHRLVCALGAWSDALAARAGIERHKPLLAMRETLLILRRLLNMERVTFAGQIYSVNDVQFDLAQGRREARRVPLYLAASSPQWLALAGEIADGVLLNYLVTPAYTQAAIAQLEVGAQVAGRSVSNLERAQLVACAVEKDRAQALQIGRRFVAAFLMHQPHVMRANGVRQELLDEVDYIMRTTPLEAQLESVMRHVTDDVVQLVCACGTPEEVRAKAYAYLEAGATQLLLYPLGGDLFLLVDTFGLGYRRT